MKIGQYKLAVYMKKHEIVNKIKSRLTRAFIKVSKRAWVNIQFKGHLVSFGYSERIYALCGSEFL